MKPQSKVTSPNKMLTHSDIQKNSLTQNIISNFEKCQGGTVSSKLWATCNLMDMMDGCDIITV